MKKYQRERWINLKSHLHGAKYCQPHQIKFCNVVGLQKPRVALPQQSLVLVLVNLTFLRFCIYINGKCLCRFAFKG